MPGNFKKDDLRVLKTRKVLLVALSNLLVLKNFNQITVYDLCEEALISRTTFYSHFIDKYDLLRCWLVDIELKIISEQDLYEDTEKRVNDFIDNNKKVIRNLLDNANPETSELLCDFILSLSHINTNKDEKGHTRPNEIIAKSFCCGGMLNYLLWQVDNKFPTDFPVINPYIYDLITKLQRWDEEQK